MGIVMGSILSNSMYLNIVSAGLIILWQMYKKMFLLIYSVNYLKLS